MNTLKEAVLLPLANAGPLPPEWRDHELAGDWGGGHRECHAGGDFPPVFRFDRERIIFVRAGTHSELFDRAVPLRRCYED